MKRIEMLFGLSIALLCSGCGTLPKGAKVRVQVGENSFHRSAIMVYNNAGPGVKIQPFSRGEGFIAEYELGKRHWSCFWLCREKIPTRVFVLKHGQKLRIPLLMNLTGYTMEQSIGLKVTQNKRVIGTYVQCVYIPQASSITRDVVFGTEELQRLKKGDPGRPCGGSSWGYWW